MEKNIEKVEKKTFKNKFEMEREDINKLPRKEIVMYSNKKYGSYYLKYDLAPYLSCTERLSNANYFIALTDNKIDLSTDRVSLKVPHRFIKGKRKDNNEYWYGIELFLSMNCRLSFFIKSRDLFALENANIKLEFEEVTIDEKEFGVEVVI